MTDPQADSPTAMMANPSVSNPDRKTTGGRVALTLVPGERTQVIAGLDQQSNTHTVRSSMNAVAMPYEAKPRTDDAAFRNIQRSGGWEVGSSPSLVVVDQGIAGRQMMVVSRAGHKPNLRGSGAARKQGAAIRSARGG